MWEATRLEAKALKTLSTRVFEEKRAQHESVGQLK
jgi:hypothetical protein